MASEVVEFNEKHSIPMQRYISFFIFSNLVNIILNHKKSRRTFNNII